MRQTAERSFYGIPKFTVFLIAALSFFCAVGTHGGPYSAGGLFLLLPAAAGAAFVALVTGKSWICAGMLLPFLLSLWLYSGDPLPLWGLLPAALSGYLVYAVRRRKSRLETVLGLAVIFGLGLLAYMASVMYHVGTFSLQAAEATLTAPFLKMQELLEQTEGVTEEWRTAWKEAMRQMALVAPTIVGGMLFLLAALQSGLLCALLRLFGVRSLAPYPWLFRVHFMTGAFFSLLYLLRWLIGSDGAVGLAMANAVGILQFPLAWHGWEQVVGWMRMRQIATGRRGTSWKFFFAVCLLVQSAVLITALALFGTVMLWTEQIRIWKREYRKKHPKE